MCNNFHSNMYFLYDKTATSNKGTRGLIPVNGKTGRPYINESKDILKSKLNADVSTNSSREIEDM